MKEEKVIDSNLLDSSIWIAYLFEDKCQEVIENNKIIFISILSLYEIKKILLQRNISNQVVNEKINFIKKRCLILELNTEITEEAAETSFKHKISALDSLIHATTIYNNLNLITLDNDFKNLDNTEIL